MHTVFILRDALASSLLTTLYYAMETRKQGRTASVIFTGSALQALAQGVFLWPVDLQEQPLKWVIADNAKNMGLPTRGRGQWRQMDVAEMVGQAAKGGVALYACPLWTELLGHKDSLPEGVAKLGTADALALVAKSDKVIGAW